MCNSESQKINTSLVLNQPRKTRVLSAINTELNSCTEYDFYVAFVNAEGVASLKQAMLEASKRGVRGRVLLSDYLQFTDPIALRELKKFRNVEIRIAASPNMHAKGYFFKQDSKRTFIIGSSNWTASALSKNTELNIKLEGQHDESIAAEIDKEFQSQFDAGTLLTEKWISRYEEERKQNKFRGQQVERSRELMNSRLEDISPNAMQMRGLLNLKRIRESNQNKAIVISATGTGKTYLAAFDAKQVNPKRLLFVVHRESIARKALDSFREVFRQSKSFGIFSGGQKDHQADFIFSTVQTISKPENLKLFAAEEFDYIIIDETHRAGARSYENIVEYFRPKFLLGMTATPERTDGKEIFRHFDHNIGCEIRLNEAMEEGMLCPFHYFGIADLSVDGAHIENNADFKKLVADERVDRIIENSAFYGTHDGKMRCLIFCSRTEECEELSKLFNQRGLRSVSLSGQSKQEERMEAIKRIESDDESQKIDYIFTVDIFNEGVDIPSLNQIIMLRPTQSAIIFV